MVLQGVPGGGVSVAQDRAAAIWDTAAVDRWKLPTPLATAKACMVNGPSICEG